MILSSSVTDLVGEIRYIQTFYYFNEEEKFGRVSFCLKNFEIALEFLKGVKLDNEPNNDEYDFELQCEEHEFSPPRKTKS